MTVGGGGEMKARGRCCPPAAAWAWVRDIAAEALAGDDNSAAILPTAINHALGGERCLQGEDAELVRAWVAHCGPHEPEVCRFCAKVRLAT